MSLDRHNCNYEGIAVFLITVSQFEGRLLMSYFTCAPLIKKALPVKIFLCFISVFTAAQQLPQYTQFIFSNYLLNPAISGIENYTELKAGYRNQWIGIVDAPVTSYVSVHAPIGRDYKFSNANSFSGRGNNPMSRSFVSTYSAAEPHHGIGLHLVNDKSGITNTTDLQATYAYHLGLAPRLNLSVGTAAGILNTSLDKSKMRPENASDPKLNAMRESVLSPQLAVGSWLYSSTFFFGLSANQLLQNSSGPIKLVPHFYATAGYKLFIAEEIALLPSMLATRVGPVYSFDYNAKLALKDRFWIGASYRSKDSFSVLAGFNISSLFNLSYSYDYSISALQQVSSGSHEIVLGLLLNNRYKVVCPQNQF